MENAPHVHWEFDSVCPRCGNVNHVQTSVGNQVAIVHCEHCIHGYEYTHVIQCHEEVPDSA